MPDTSKQKGDTVTDSPLNVDTHHSSRAGAAQPQGAEAAQVATF
ncbi:hypothetical protein [Thermomonas sp.]|nr:hypothetical protein [Thermomonas sp.]